MSPPAPLPQAQSPGAAFLPPAGDAAAALPRSALEARMRRVVQDNYAFLWRTLRRLGVPEASVEDAAQNVLCVLARRLGEVPPSSERSFLIGTAIRVASDARRGARRRREDPADDPAAHVAHPGPSPEQSARESDARRVLGDILDAMPDELRAVFVLFELEELPLAEVATLLELPGGTAASRLRRAREHFQAAAERFRAVERRMSGEGGPR